MSATPAARGAWIASLLRLKPARVPLGHTIRSGLTVGGPFVVGVLTDQIIIGMWIALACLLLAPGEREGSHRLNVRILLIATPIAASGYLLGFAQDLPLWALVPLVMVLAFVAGAIPAYGAPYSVAGMQFLLIASLALGVHGIDWWQPIGWYVVGAALYLALMLLDFAIERRRPERLVVTDLLRAISALAAARSAEMQGHGDEVATAKQRAAALGAVDAARTVQVTGRSGAAGRAGHWDALAALVDTAESTAALLVGSDDVAELEAARSRLEGLLGDSRLRDGRPRDARRSSRAVPPAVPGALGARLADLAEAASSLDLGLNPAAGPASSASSGSPSGSSVSTPAPVPGPATPTGQLTWRDRLVLGPDALAAAGRLALVFGAAVAARGYFPYAHWFWVPLTVALVMKPDFGSVFARAVLRIVGTAIGVLLATGVLALTHLPALHAHGQLVIAIAITVLAAAVPWFMIRSYTLQAVAIAPIVVLLVALITPGGAETNYSAERLGATAVGGALVLVLGYALWPSARTTDVPGRLQTVLGALSDYLAAAGAASDAPGRDGVATTAVGDRHTVLVAARRATYSGLADLRTQLQRALTEAPPASTRAQEWIPAVAALERLADAVSVLAARHVSWASQGRPVAAGGPSDEARPSDEAGPSYEARSHEARSHEAAPADIVAARQAIEALRGQRDPLVVHRTAVELRARLLT